MSDAQREMLAKLAVSQTTPVRQVQRARVLARIQAGQACRPALRDALEALTPVLQ